MSIVPTSALQIGRFPTLQSKEHHGKGRKASLVAA